MSDILLEKNGVDNTSLDGALFNKFCAGYKDGIIQGAYSECALSLAASNILYMAKGELLINGFRVVSEPKNFQYSSFPSSSTRYQIIGQITLSSSQPIFSCFVRAVSNTYTQDNFYGGATSGTYQVEIARFTLTSSGIEDFTRTLDVIKGSNSGTTISIGDVVTEKIDYTLDAEVDIDERVEDDGTKYFDFKFSLPMDITNMVEDKVNEAIKSADYVTLTTSQEISGTKNFTDAIQLNSLVKMYSETDDDGDVNLVIEFEEGE